jgi:HEAT repeat protein
MARSTGKILKLPDLGGGLLAGGRGLPDDLSAADTTGGKVKQRKVEGDLDKLLTDFEKLDLSALEETQTAIVEKIQLGSKEELLGEMPRIRKLISHPNGDIRRTAVWALGRSGDLRDANLLIQRFEESDVGVVVEANNALCYLSRKLAGIGVPEDPFEHLGEKPSQAQQDEALAAWRKDAIEKWTRWYLRVRPFDDRNDLFQLKFGRSVKKKK